MHKFGKFTSIKQVKSFDALFNSKYKELCLNDDTSLSDKEFEIVTQNMKNAFENKFPDKSSFEKWDNMTDDKKYLAGIVTFNPDIERLNENISAIINQVDKVVVVAPDVYYFGALFLHHLHYHPRKD